MKKITLLIFALCSLISTMEAQFIQPNSSMYGSRSNGVENKQEPTISIEELLTRLKQTGNQNGIDSQQFTSAERQALNAHFGVQNSSNRSPQATLLTEGFDDITTLPGAGFTFVNASDTPNTDWFQGNDAVFPSQAGGPTAYVAANWANTNGTVINNFMITPVLNLENGDEIKFWTRTATGSTFPDRLEVRLDPTGANTDPTGPTSVGSYTELLLDINPTLVTGVYPQVWTEFTAVVSGLSGAVNTRAAFRYWVTNAGPTGANSDFIGIDTLSVEEGAGGGGGGGCTPDSLDTLYAGGNFGSVGGAVYFDITVGATDLDVTSFDMNTAEAGAFTADVYVFEGTYVGNQANPALWGTAVATGSGTGAGAGLPSTATLDAPITMSAGTTYAVALVFDATHAHTYTNGDGTNQNYSNGDITIDLGSASNVPFTAPIFDPRVWNGTVGYCVGGGGGGGTYDDCSGAIALACGDSVIGETLTATDSGGNPAPDVFYKFTGSGSAQLVTISLCAATDFDTVLRIFEDCTLTNEIAVNDDSCGLQSEVSFTSDGTSTYIIMVEGFGTNAGNFSLDVTCAQPLPNDECSGAIAVTCGDSVMGSTVGATIDSTTPACGPGITSPGVWYSLNDNSGLAGDITLSLCNGTDFDSKISVYSGTCSALVCVDGNDDACGLQSEITFASDGNTQYYILIHSFGGATGNFTMDVTCTPTPPPNDMIANSIDVDEIGFPYTDPSVAMPAATTEGGNPVNCDLTGANGVWYNFVAGGDGTANAMIVTPGGASSVTFYTAPNENAVETDLTLVPQQANQCGPGTSATIFTLAGQAYYVFVLNTGAITDIVIDGTNLGVSDNTIAGFSYYPNPTNGVLNLKSIDNIDNISLYNVLGQLVIDNRVNATTSQVDMSGLSTGTYLMRVSVNGEIGTYRVLKQ